MADYQGDALLQVIGLVIDHLANGDDASARVWFEGVRTEYHLSPSGNYLAISLSNGSYVKLTATIVDPKPAYWFLPETGTSMEE